MDRRISQVTAAIEGLPRLFSTKSKAIHIFVYSSCFCPLRRQTAPTTELHSVEPDRRLGGGVVRRGLRRRPAAVLPAGGLLRGRRQAQVTTCNAGQTFTSNGHINLAFVGCESREGEESVLYLILACSCDAILTTS